MAAMGVGITKGGRGPWLFLVVGAAIGLALGILVSLTTDVPLAPEAGLVIGLFVGWLHHAIGADREASCERPVRDGAELSGGGPNCNGAERTTTGDLIRSIRRRLGAMSTVGRHGTPFGHIRRQSRSIDRDRREFAAFSKWSVRGSNP